MGFAYSFLVLSKPLTFFFFFLRFSLLLLYVARNPQRVQVRAGLQGHIICHGFYFLNLNPQSEINMSIRTERLRKINEQGNQ